MCFSCYKSQLHILKQTKNVSTDSDLKALITEARHTMLKLEDIKNDEDAIDRAMSMTTVRVGEAILVQQGLLLPDVHNYFLQQINASFSTSGKENSLSARWVLSNLTITLQHHLSYVCKIRKCGTLLY